MTGDLDRERLAQVLGMLGSAHEGEIVAAARQAEKIRRGAGATWHDIVSPAAAPPMPGTISSALSLEARVELCVDHLHLLSDWERRFIRSIAGRPVHRLSIKQVGVVNRLVRAVLAQRGAP